MSMPGPEDEGLTSELRPDADSACQIVRLNSSPVPSLTDIGGLKEELRRLREAVELPLKHGEVLRRKGICPAKLVIAYGPPGAGKSLLIKAFAADAGLRLFTVKWQQLVARSDDDSRRLLADTMARARANMPSLVVLDDLEYAGFGYGPVSELSRKKSAQIAEVVDTIGRDENILVIAVSTSAFAVDPVMRKAGYLIEEIEFRLPGTADRKNILALHASGIMLQDVDLARLASATNGFSGADLALLVRNSFAIALRRAVQNEGMSLASIEKAIVTDADFRTVLQTMKAKNEPESRGEVI